MKTTLQVLGGAIIGGLAGYFAFSWMTTQGFYALVLPGGLLGLGAGWSQNRSVGLAVVCGIAALSLGLYTEWRFFPFLQDGSLSFFLTHLHELRPVTLLMISAGAFIGFWVPFRQVPARQGN